MYSTVKTVSSVSIQHSVMLTHRSGGVQNELEVSKGSNKCIAVRKVATPLRELTCHMGSHSATCHPAEVTFPPLPQPKLVLDKATPKGYKAELTSLASYIQRQYTRPKTVTHPFSCFFSTLPGKKGKLEHTYFCLSAVCCLSCMKWEWTRTLLLSRF